MSDQQQEYTSHVWHYRANRNVSSDVHEFPMPIKKQTAENLIAQRLGLKELPDGATVGQNPLEPLPPLEEKSKPSKE